MKIIFQKLFLILKTDKIFSNALMPLLVMLFYFQKEFLVAVLKVQNLKVTEGY